MASLLVHMFSSSSTRVAARACAAANRITIISGHQLAVRTRLETEGTAAGAAGWGGSRRRLSAGVRERSGGSVYARLACGFAH